ncbi:nitroreductase [Aquabacter sp. CN5-332]|uniref:nitroreductase family protein n=1 Tax=Aquabacter sp. CN5-332 TaxID=3156608 RepID=UPI0032B47E66
MAQPAGHSHSHVPAHDGTAIAAPTSPETIALLKGRRSLPLRSLVEPGPGEDEIAAMLALAARVPDHGRLVPWRFILLKGEGRAQAGDRLDALYLRQNPDLPPVKSDMWRTYLMRAPLTVVAVSRPDPTSKVPEFNQVLSAGAACMNLIAAATALGYAAHWLLKWPGRDAEAAALLGVGEGEKVAGFIHIGSPAEQVADRPRPVLTEVVTVWEP